MGYPQEIWVKARLCRDGGMRLGAQRLQPSPSALKGKGVIMNDSGRGGLLGRFKQSTGWKVCASHNPPKPPFTKGGE
jgi:hypothetical protein